eukprot:g47368.t1
MCCLKIFGHTEKIYSIKFHPLASDILASSSYDMTVRIWDISSGKEEIILKGHTEQIFSLSWSPDGQQLATVSKDGKVRVYDPRRSVNPVQEGPGPVGSRGARILWVSDGRYLLISGFDRSRWDLNLGLRRDITTDHKTIPTSSNVIMTSRSERQISLHDVGSLALGPLATTDINAAPSTLIPFYDDDTSIVYLTGKGDTRVHIYEIQTDAPYFLQCSSFNSTEPHKKEFFQDDIFPDTTMWWQPVLSASAWLAGSNGQHKKLSLKPEDMVPVSEAPKEVPNRKYKPSAFYLEEKTDEEKKEELLSAMVAKLGNLDDPLPQDSFEGVDEDEWALLA